MNAARTSCLPIIDLAGLRMAEPAALASIAGSIRNACLSNGFFYVTNHEVPGPLQQSVLHEVVRFFDLPSAEKDRLKIGQSNHMRGYFGYGADRSDGVNGDFKEGFDLGPEVALTDASVLAKLPFYGPNLWPQSLPDFRHHLTCYYGHMFRLGLDLLRAFSIGLGITKSYFDSCFAKPIAQLRLLRYPGVSDKSTVQTGAGEHTDFGCITIILQDAVDGLEIQNRDGKWIPVPAIPDTLVVNVGDLMQRWTNDEYQATMHRVINCADAARHSVAFFMDPDYHTTVDCLPVCIQEGRPARYPPIIVGDYMNQRFLETTTFARQNSAI